MAATKHKLDILITAFSLLLYNTLLYALWRPCFIFGDILHISEMLRYCDCKRLSIFDVHRLFVYFTKRVHRNHHVFHFFRSIASCDHQMTDCVNYHFIGPYVHLIFITMVHNPLLSGHPHCTPTFFFATSTNFYLRLSSSFAPNFGCTSWQVDLCLADRIFQPLCVCNWLEEMERT